MPKITIRIGNREHLQPAISKATLLLPTDALVWIGTTNIAGTATAIRALADALTQAAELADAYDADPDAWNRREHAEPAADP